MPGQSADAMVGDFRPWPTQRKVGHYRMPFRLKGPSSDIVHVEEPYWRFEPRQWRTMCGKTLVVGSSLAGNTPGTVNCKKCRALIAERIAIWTMLLEIEPREA